MSIRPLARWRRIRRTKTWRLLSLTITVGVAWYCWPAAYGGSMTTVAVSGSSMEPTYHTNDLVLLRKSSSYSPGDIAVYIIPRGQPGEGHQVIHRIKSIDENGRFMLQGDNKPSVDDWIIHKDDIQGKAVVLVPQGARYLSLLFSPLVLGVAGAALVVRLLLPPRAESGKADEGALTGMPPASGG